ncbi:hypothetical protein HS99_0009895 [Kitasatospora aureofaciens]|uniref:Peptidase inhibitor family I36 n=1 Tax=Kitasatospora aureofaciens TaxID=1894 RepID=A0A1E7N285_KITAU|nr:hypothetical protein HS99_0009895 [Kitasatospora aureofaciens]GGU92370.1 hypothetical protein GCM10010502_52270 [Kitasatospora aureofaciens]
MPEHYVQRPVAPRRIIAALVLTLLALVGATSTATAQAPATSSFTAQAYALGLTPVQATSLQARVDTYLARTGGTQVAADRILLPGGGELRLALPGERQPRDLAASGNAPLASLACPYTWVCAYSAPYYEGDVLMLYTCNKLNPVPWYGTGSWINNQRSDLHAKFYDHGGNLGWTSPGGYSSDPTAPWDWVGYLSPC